jgi:hypothetical protein
MPGFKLRTFEEKTPVSNGDEIVSSESADSLPRNLSEKKDQDIEIEAVEPDFETLSTDKIYVPNDNDEFIDPRLKDYPVPLVA